MGFKIVVLWTDLALWALFAGIGAYAWRVSRHPTLRATWRRVLRDPAALSSGLVLLVFVVITLADSLHFRRVLPPSPSQAAGQVFYDTRTESLLDLALARQLAMRESTYSAPLATHALTRQTITRDDGQIVREHPRLAHAGAHLADPVRDRGRICSPAAPRA